jgi:hypothetical protein
MHRRGRGHFAKEEEGTCGMFPFDFTPRRSCHVGAFQKVFVNSSQTLVNLFLCFRVACFRLQNLLAGIKAKKAAKFTADKEALVQKLKSEQAAAPAAL